MKAIQEIMDSYYQKSLDGFLLVLSQEGDMIYISDNVSKFIGLNQVGLSICDVRLSLNSTMAKPWMPKLLNTLLTESN